MTEKLTTEKQIEKLNRMFDRNNKIETDEDLIEMAKGFEEDE